MLENLRTGGEGRYYDDRAARASASARAAEGYAVSFLAAVHANQPQSRLVSGSGSDDLVGVIRDLLYHDKLAAELVTAMHLASTGKFEASSKALLEWLESAALVHAQETVELQEIDA